MISLLSGRWVCHRPMGSFPVVNPFCLHRLCAAQLGSVVESFLVVPSPHQVGPAPCQRPGPGHIGATRHANTQLYQPWPAHGHCPFHRPDRQAPTLSDLGDGLVELEMGDVELGARLVGPLDVLDELVADASQLRATMQGRRPDRRTTTAARTNAARVGWLEATLAELLADLDRADILADAARAIEQARRDLADNRWETMA